MFSSHGEVLYAGSFVMDLLVWKDIDLNIIVEKNKRNEVAKKLVSDFLDREDVTRIKILKDLFQKYGDCMPNSLYVGVEISGWKFDIHILDEKEASKTKQKTDKFLSAMTDEKKEKILFYKNELIEKYGRCPKFSSYHLYHAILFENLQNTDEIYQYLRLKGVKV